MPWLLSAVVLAIAASLLAAPAAPARLRHKAAHGAPGAGAGEAGAGEAGAGEAGAGGAGAGEAGAGEARAGSCHLRLESAPRRVTAGEAATLTGTVSCTGSAQAGEQTVTIYLHTAGTPGASPVGVVTPQASGSFAFTSEALEANSSFYASVSGARSGRIHVLVAPRVTVSGPAAHSQLVIGGQRAAADSLLSSTVTFTGTVSPEQRRAVVELQRERPNIEGSWFSVARARIGAGASYSITHTFGIPGVANVRVLVKAPGRPTAVSETLAYEIVRRQSSHITIDASVDPLAYEGSLTISGIAAGAGHQSLTLLASNGGRALVPVAHTVSESDGSYTFASLSPRRGTAYEVKSAHTHSSTLLEGVRRTLDAQVSAASAQGGALVEASGVATPAREGEVVKLARENAAGSELRVVATATLGPGGRFSIERAVAGAGVQTYRIVVPAGEGLQTTTSAPLQVELPEAATSALGSQLPAPALAGS